MELRSQQRNLRAAALVVVGSGVLVAMASVEALEGPALLLLDLMVWPLDGEQRLAGLEPRLLSAISGGVMVGWGALIYLLAGELMHDHPAIVRRIVLVSLGLWFCVDSLGSFAAGVPASLIGNLMFLGLFVWVLRRPASADAVA